MRIRNATKETSVVLENIPDNVYCYVSSYDRLYFRSCKSGFRQS